MQALLAAWPFGRECFIDPAYQWPWAIAIFVLGAIIGSFLNVCIYRLPMEKSIFWPLTSHCMSCYRPIRAYDNIPLVSYWALGGRCRDCGQPYSIRFWLIELGTGLALAGLYWLEVVRNIHGLNAHVLGPDRFAAARWAAFGFHGVLLCFLIVATFSDFDHQMIPLPLTITGTLVGLIGSVLFPWPWPYTPAQAVVSSYTDQPWNVISIQIRDALYPWPVWGPLPGWLQPGGNWKTGLATGLAGAFVGSFLLRAVRFLFGLGMGAAYSDPKEVDEHEIPRGMGRRFVSWFQRVGGRALGLGDADLMMMCGSFLGWQPVVIAFVLGVGAGLVLGLIYLIFRRSHTLPFGPALAVGTMATILLWPRLGRHFRMLFFDSFFMPWIALICVGGLVIVTFLLRALRLFRT
jgi:leader peptidase (prepilin peptidase)/N-methyltransferase